MQAEYVVTKEFHNKRLDVFLTKIISMDSLVSEEYGTLSRSHIQNLIQDNQVTLLGIPRKSNYKVNEGECFVVLLPEPRSIDIEPEDIPLDILFEDNDVILVNKPKGIVVHPAAGHYSGTLVNALMYHCRDNLSGINGVLRPGIVHRIDKDTTGVLIACKNDFSHNFISAQLAEHSITRKYRAIVHGVISKDELTIEGTIGRHPNDRKKMAINVKNGKPAVTHVTVLERFRNATYIECTLETGRTHQIRVHLTSIGHPLLGDEIYGHVKEKFNLQGQTLHAMTLGFIHPTSKEYMEFTAPLPDYFQSLLNHLA